MFHIGEDLDSREIVILNDGLGSLTGEMIYGAITASLDKYHGILCIR